MYYWLIYGCVDLAYLYSTLFYHYYSLLPFFFATITPLVLFPPSFPFLSVIGLDCDSYAGAGIIRQFGGVLEYERLLFLFFHFPTRSLGWLFFFFSSSLLLGKKNHVR